MAIATSNISNVSAALKDRAKASVLTYVQTVRRLAEGEELKSQDLARLEQAMATTGKTEKDLDSDIVALRAFTTKSKAREQIPAAREAAAAAAKQVISYSQLQAQILELRKTSASTQQEYTRAASRVTALHLLVEEANALATSHPHILADVRVKALEATAARVPGLEAKIEEHKESLRVAMVEADRLLGVANEASELSNYRRGDQFLYQAARDAMGQWEQAVVKVKDIEREIKTCESTIRDAVLAGAEADQLRASFPYLFADQEGA